MSDTITKGRSKSTSEQEQSKDPSSYIVGSPGQPFASSFITVSPGTGAILPRETSKRQSIDFILCIGDDRLDEVMFEYFRSDEGHHRTSSGTESILSPNEVSSVESYPQNDEIHTQFGTVNANFLDSLLRSSPNMLYRSVWTVTVGLKSSAAQYYLPTYVDVLNFLALLAQDKK